MSSRGLFITVEGIDGCGKSTQARLIAAALEAAGHDVLRLREPGGVKISEQIREILLDPANAEMGDVCELLLYEAARAQLVHQVIRPALAAGKTVVCDRFYDSTTAYQAFADGLEFQERVAAGFRAVAADEPDRVKLIDAGESIAEVFSGVAAELRSAGLSVSEDDVAAALQACQGKC